MRLRQRISKLERQTGATDNFCRCGTPYFQTFVIGGEDIVNEFCPVCSREVKPLTRAEFASVAHLYEYEGILPRVH